MLNNEKLQGSTNRTGAQSQTWENEREPHGERIAQLLKDLSIEQTMRATASSVRLLSLEQTKKMNNSFEILPHTLLCPFNFPTFGFKKRYLRRRKLTHSPFIKLN